MSEQIEFGVLIEPVARLLWGDPNPQLSNKGELRWGSHGSRSIKVATGQWFDHELDDGGGVLALITRETGYKGKDAVDWLHEQALTSPQPKPNGSNGAHNNGAQPTSAARHRQVATYDYRRLDGTLAYQVVRLEPKTFRQRRPDSAGGWTWNMTGVEPLPYRLPELAEAIAAERMVCIVEGEKDADNLARIGVTATTSHGGAGKWRPELNRYLKGAKVAILPDNDDAGRNHAQDVKRQLAGIAAEVLIVGLPGLQQKQDVSDWITCGGTKDQLRALVNDARRRPNGDAGAEDEETEHEPGADSGCAGEGWPDPDMAILDAGRRQPPEFPLALLAPWDGWIKDAAEAAGAPVDYVAGPMLTTFAALIGNARAASPWSDWVEPSVLWCGLVGDPSDGKSPATDALLSAVRDVEREMGAGFDERYRDWQSKAEAARVAHDRWKRDVEEAVKNDRSSPPVPSAAVAPSEPQRPRVLISDTSIEALARVLAGNPRGLLAHRDELAGLIGNFDRYGGRGGDRALWIEAYGARPYTIDRVKHAEPIRIPRVAVSIIGAIQPDRLASLLKGDDDGLTSRFLWLWPTPLPPRRPSRSPDREQLMRSARRLAGLLPGTEGPIVLPLADDASAVFQQWREDHFRDKTAGMLSSAYGKMPGFVLRLALVLRLGRWAAGETIEPRDIDDAALRASVALIEAYVKPMAQRVYGDAALPASTRGAATIARWIVRGRHERFNARELRRKGRLPGLAEPRPMQDALDVLVDAGWVRSDPTRTGNTPGRKSSDYSVNPMIARVS